MANKIPIHKPSLKVIVKKERLDKSIRQDKKDNRRLRRELIKMAHKKCNPKDVIYCRTLMGGPPVVITVEDVRKNRVNWNTMTLKRKE